MHVAFKGYKTKYDTLTAVNTFSQKILHASAGFFVFQTSPRCDIMHAEGRGKAIFLKKPANLPFCKGLLRNCKADAVEFGAFFAIMGSPN